MMIRLKLAGFVLVGIALLLNGAGNIAVAAEKSLSQNKPASTYVVMATITVKPQHFAQFVQETLPLIEKSRAEAGLKIYQLHQSHQNPLQFMWYEHFDDKAAFDFHVQSSHVSAWAKIVGELASVQLVATPFHFVESGADIVAPQN